MASPLQGPEGEMSNWAALTNGPKIRVWGVPTPSHGLRSGSSEVTKEGGRAQGSPDNGTMQKGFLGAGPEDKHREHGLGWRTAMGLRNQHGPTTRSRLKEPADPSHHPREA